MHVTQYRPAYFSGFENEEHDVDTAEQLLALPFVENFRHEGFHRFALTDQNMLLAEYHGGTEWWVVARIDDPTPLVGKIPTWDADAAMKRHDKADRIKSRSSNGQES